MEHARTIISIELMFILVFAALIVIDSVGDLNSITGRAVEAPSQQEILEEIESAIPNLDFVQEADDFDMCLIVNLGDGTKYSYQVLKLAGAIVVTSSSELYCKGQENEDFIVSYVSYDKLKEHLDTLPSLKEFKDTGDGTNFYVLPSKEVNPGGSLANPAEFNERFGDTLRSNLPSSEVREIISRSNSVSESPTPITSYILYFVIGLVSLVVVLSFVIFKSSKKPEIKEDLELVSYIKSSLAQGYNQEQIKQTLLQAGWKEEQVNESLNKANEGVQMPENFA